MAIPQLTPRAAHDALTTNPDAVYLDVRTAGEFEAGRPAGARNVPVFEPHPVTHRPRLNPDFVATVEGSVPRSAKLLVGCQAGVRSQHACELLAAAGFTDVSNVAGGFGGGQDAYGNPVAGWVESGLPVEKGPAR